MAEENKIKSPKAYNDQLSRKYNVLKTMTKAAKMKNEYSNENGAIGWRRSGSILSITFVAAIVALWPKAYIIVLRRRRMAAKKKILEQQSKQGNT